MSDIIVPAAVFRREQRIANSRFIATIGPAATVLEAKDFIAKISQEFGDASHNVPAYVIGSGSSTISHCSDAGEPSGTAGRPALAVLAGSGLGDTALVISRYFGGTKLGTGGLVKAYSDAAREVIAGVPKAKKIQVHQARLSIPYSQYQQASRTIQLHTGQIDRERFDENSHLEFSIPVESYESLKQALTNLTHGRAVPEIVRADQIKLVPLGGKQ